MQNVIKDSTKPLFSAAKLNNLSQVQKIPNLAYQIYQTLQIYWVYEKDDIKYKYDRKWKTENMAEKHHFHK